MKIGRRAILGTALLIALGVAAVAIDADDAPSHGPPVSSEIAVR